MGRSTKPVKRFSRPLEPSHGSWGGARHVPYGMSRIRVGGEEMRSGLTAIALDIFTDMTNANHSFQDALLAIYISGLQHGSAFSQEPIP